MKKRVFCCILALVIVVSFSSCLSLLFSHKYKYTIDKQNPADQNATLIFKGWYLVREWNGVNIHDDVYEKSAWQGDGVTVTLTIPSGNGSVTFDTSFIIGDVEYSVKGVELQYYFEAGKKYQVKSRADTKGFFKITGDLFLGIYDVTKGSTLLKEWKVREI